MLGSLIIKFVTSPLDRNEHEKQSSDPEQGFLELNSINSGPHYQKYPEPQFSNVPYPQRGSDFPKVLSSHGDIWTGFQESPRILDVEQNLVNVCK